MTRSLLSLQILPVADSQNFICSHIFPFTESKQFQAQLLNKYIYYCLSNNLNMKIGIFDIKHLKSMVSKCNLKFNTNIRKKA